MGLGDNGNLTKHSASQVWSSRVEKMLEMQILTRTPQTLGAEPSSVLQGTL